MSALATFTLLPFTSVGELPDDYEGVIARDGREAVECCLSGYLFGTLLPYLSGQGIELMRSPFDRTLRPLCQARDQTIFILTPSHKYAYLGRLDPTLFSADTLRDYYNEFNAASEPEVGQAMLEGIDTLRQNLEALDDDSVILFSIG